MTNLGFVASERPTARPTPAAGLPDHQRHLRFLHAHADLAPAFGNDGFALKAEAFARFFGTPVFLVRQTLVVAIWIVGNVAGLWKF